jgi:undecaprenol kinase
MPILSATPKKRGFVRRLRFAFAGLRSAASGEASFRAQLAAAALSLTFLLWKRPAPVWWALVATISAAVLAAELLNTALESAVDALHPAHHPLIGRAKDCAAAAVLVLSFGAIAVFAALLVAS